MGDPVALGIVDNIARPGGNITGISVDAGFDIWGKRLQLLREVVPAASKAEFLASSNVWKLATQAKTQSARSLSLIGGLTLIGGGHLAGRACGRGEKRAGKLLRRGRGIIPSERKPLFSGGWKESKGLLVRPLTRARMVLR
jgi:hypothetical protein